jgi:hypothetical protein
MGMAELDETNTRPQKHGMMVGNENVIQTLIITSVMVSNV